MATASTDNQLNGFKDLSVAASSTKPAGKSTEKRNENDDDNKSVSSYESADSEFNDAVEGDVQPQRQQPEQSQQPQPQKRTVLSYSTYKPGSTTITTKTLNVNSKSGSQNELNSPNADDKFYDYHNSNQLNEVVRSKQIELHYFVFHNNVECVRAYIDKYRSKLRDEELARKKKSPGTQRAKEDPSAPGSLDSRLSDYLSIRDIHGNTPLHLACMLGHVEIVKLLTEAGAVVKARNKQMWTPLNEAVSFGNRDLIKHTLKKFEKEVDVIVKGAKPQVIGALKEMENFYVEIKWDFESWIPLVSRFLPSDVCKLHKYGTKLRLDCTLGDLARATGKSGSNESAANSSGATASPFNWHRGDFTFIFEIEKIGDKDSILFMDNRKKTFSSIETQMPDENSECVDDELKEFELEKEIDLLLGKEMIYLKLNTRQAHFLPTQTGWFTKREKVEAVNGYQCQFYDVSNLFIVSKLRSEHLSEEELKRKEEKQKRLKEKLNSQQNMKQLVKKPSKENVSLKSSPSTNNANGLVSKGSSNELDQIDIDLDEELEEAIEYRPSLPPPVTNRVSWNEYITASEGEWPCLGRKLRCKESRKEFKAQLAMEFPLTINDLNKLLDALVPLAKFRKLKEFINSKLPPGFPVKIDIPIVPTVSAKVSFQNFKKLSTNNENLFKVPGDYTEDKIDLLGAVIEKQKAEQQQQQQAGSPTSKEPETVSI